MKLMIWWAQRLGVDGLAWSSSEMQFARWGDRGPPEMLYKKFLPEAARSLSTTLTLTLDQTQLSVRNNNRCVELGKQGWEVRNQDNAPITKPFRTRAQAEHFADLTGNFSVIRVPVLWLKGLAKICSIPLYGTAADAAWRM